ncbi:hypothetical protein [Nonomuraea sp. NPDC052265]
MSVVERIRHWRNLPGRRQLVRTGMSIAPRTLVPIIETKALDEAEEST